MKTKLLITLLCLPILCFCQFRLVKDIISGVDDSSPYNFIDYNNKVFFYTNAAFATDERINLSDATELGTNFLKDQNGNVLIPNVNDSATDWAILNNELFFPAQNLNDGVELYKIGPNDTNASLVLEIAAGSAYSNPVDFTQLGNNLIFSANDNINGRELWITDGTTAGTQLLKDIDTAFDGSPKYLFSYNGNVYFSATDVTNGRELWITDGTTSGTQLLKDIAPGITDSGPRDFISFNGKVYFTANDGSTGRELWVTDGTSAGTLLVQDLNSGSTGSSPYLMTIFNDNLVFVANVPSVGVELVKMNPSQSITSLGNINTSGDSNPEGLTVFNGTLYFSADNGTSGRELYSTNGFQSGTGLVADINTSGDSNPDHFITYNNKLYFSANDGTTGVELWSYDSTNGAQLVEDLNAGGSGDSNPIPQITYGNELLLTVDADGTTGVELWSYIDPSFQTYVPDDNFEQALITQGYDSVLDDYVSTGSINAITDLTIGNTAITDLTGIEDFVSLKVFQSWGNSYTTLDVSQNSNLTFLAVNEFDLANLMLSSTTNPNFKEFYFGGTQITSLDFSGFSTLETVLSNGGNTSLTNISFANCTNSNLSVNLSQGEYNLSSINLTNATAIKGLSLAGTSTNVLPISSMDISDLTGLTIFSCIYSGLQALDLSTHNLIEVINLRDNTQLTNLNVKNGNNGIITYFDTRGTNVACVGVDNATAANAGTGVYASWQKDAATVYSENCSTLSNEDFELTNVELFPNPVSNTFTIKGLENKEASVTIFDLNGRQVKTFKTITETLNIEELVSGIYIVEIKTKQGSFNQRLVKY